MRSLFVLIIVYFLSHFFCFLLSFFLPFFQKRVVNKTSVISQFPGTRLRCHVKWFFPLLFVFLVWFGCLLWCCCGFSFEGKCVSRPVMTSAVDWAVQVNDLSRVSRPVMTSAVDWAVQVNALSSVCRLFGTVPS